MKVRRLRNMKIAILENSYKFVIKKGPKPEVGSCSVGIKIQFCSICGSDIHMYKWGPKPQDPSEVKLVSFLDSILGFPAHSLLGHQVSGNIEEIGPEVEGFNVGDRVSVRTRGAYADFIISEESQVYHLPDEVTYKQAAFIEPVSVAVSAVRRSKVKLGDVVVVLGAGPIGLFTAQCAIAAGASRVYVSEISELRLKKAKEFGVDEAINAKKVNVVQRINDLTRGLGPDVVFECAGKPETMWQMLNMLPRYGKGVIVAVYEKPFEIDPNRIMMKNLDIAGILPTRGEGRQDQFNIAIALIKTGKVRVDPIITATYSLNKINEAFINLIKGEQVGVLIKP
jgi:(R,R)-butanediol dehydrogenase/meso-butanediol dehydrogenase/diacetyl reductase